MNQANVRAILLLQLGLLFFVVGDSLVKILLETVPIGQLLWLRTLCAMVLMLLFMLATGRLPLLRVQKRFQLALRGLFFTAVSIGLYIALRHFPISTVTTAFAGAPIIISAISPLVLKEHATTGQWLATITGFVGICLVLKPEVDNLDWYYLILLSLPFCYAFMMLWTKRLSSTETDWALNFYSYFPLVLLTSYTALNSWVPLSPTEFAMTAVSGVTGAVGFFLLVSAFRIGKPVIIAPFEYSAILMALCIDIAFWHFLPDQWLWLGVGLIISCGIFQGWQARIEPPIITPHIRPEDTHRDNS